MQTHIQTRLEGLKKEFEIGQARLQDLESQQTRLRETLLRISGAIQVLEEVSKGSEGQEEASLAAASGQTAD